MGWLWQPFPTAAAEQALELVGAVQVLETYARVPPTSFVRVAQPGVAGPPVEVFFARAWATRAATVQPPASAAAVFQRFETPPEIITLRTFLPSVRTFVELTGKARVFPGNQERFRDFLGTVQVVENYGAKAPLTVVRPGWHLSPPVAAAAETVQAWLPRASSALALASSSRIVLPPQAIEAFYPRGWEARAASRQPPASSSVSFLVQPAIEAFYPTAWRVSVRTVLEGRSWTAIVQLVSEPVPPTFVAGQPIAWTPQIVRTAVAPTSRAATFQIVTPRIEVFYPQAWPVAIKTAIDAAGFAATWQLVREPAAAVVQPIAWQASVRTGLEPRTDAATFQVVEPAVEVFYPQARQARTRTAVEPRSKTSLFRSPYPSEIQTFQAWVPRRVASVQALRSRIWIIQPSVAASFGEFGRHRGLDGLIDPTRTLDGLIDPNRTLRGEIRPRKTLQGEAF